MTPQHPADRGIDVMSGLGYRDPRAAASWRPDPADGHPVARFGADHSFALAAACLVLPHSGQNPHWTPAYSSTSQIRDPADLAHSPGDVITVLTAVHHATDAIHRIAATDHQAVLEAAAINRLYVPTRLLADKYDIPHPYAPAHTQTRS